MKLVIVGNRLLLLVKNKQIAKGEYTCSRAYCIMLILESLIPNTLTSKMFYFPPLTSLILWDPNFTEEEAR